MNHRQTIDRFLAYAEGRLSDSDRAAVEQHLAGCPLCQSSHAVLRRATYESAPAPDLQPDPYLPARIRTQAASNEQAGQHRWMPVLRWSAVSLGLSAALVLGIFLGYGLSNATSDSTMTDDVVNVFASSITAADPGDQWSAVAGIGGEVVP